MPAAQPLTLSTPENVVVLALSPGTQHRIFASAVDNVGNRRPLEEDAMENSIIIDIPITEGSCTNNCFERGNCSRFGTCQCEAGYFGNDCSLGKDLLMG